MKKLFLLILPIVALTLTSCSKGGSEDSWTDNSPIITFTDPYFLEALLLHDVDKNSDRQISEKEAKQAIFLSLNTANKIRTLEEIKYFTALEQLFCAENQLTSLDLSKNTALTILECPYNQLTMLDVSKNTALTNLYCYDNQLTSLDVSKNTALESLYCNDNQLTSLDLTKNTALIYMDCSDNQLTSLDVSKNTALINLYCGGDQLTSLDLSKNTALTSLTCYGSQIAELDLRNNTALKSLSLKHYDAYRNDKIKTLYLYKYHTISQITIEAIEKYCPNLTIHYVE